jgi:hypothetical protein
MKRLVAGEREAGRPALPMCRDVLGCVSAASVIGCGAKRGHAREKKGGLAGTAEGPGLVI